MDTPDCSLPVEERQNTGAAGKYKASVRPWDMRSADESGGLKRTSEDRDRFLSQFQKRRQQVQERDYALAVYDATLSSGAIKRRSFAGFPATMPLSGTSCVTTLPAPTRAFSPMTRFERIVAPEPMEAPFFTSVGSTFQSFSDWSSPSELVARG